MAASFMAHSSGDHVIVWHVHAIEAADLTHDTGLTSPVAAAVGIVATAILDDIRASRP